MLRLVRDEECAPEEPETPKADIIDFHQWRVENDPEWVEQEITRLYRLADGHMEVARAIHRSYFRLVK